VQLAWLRGRRALSGELPGAAVGVRARSRRISGATREALLPGECSSVLSECSSSVLSVCNSSVLSVCSSSVHGVRSSSALSVCSSCVSVLPQSIEAFA
jgi:hypothetical protein